MTTRPRRGSQRHAELDGAAGSTDVAQLAARLAAQPAAQLAAKLAAKLAASHRQK